MGWDVCTDHNSFSLLSKIPQLLSAVLWAVVWAPLGCAGQSHWLQDPLAGQSFMYSLCGGPRAAARPGALLYSHGKPPFLGSSPAQHHVPYSHLIF